MLSRRQLLAAAGTAATMPALTGCAGLRDVLGVGDAVRVAVTWSDTELKAFQAVLAGLHPAGYRIDVIPLGDDIEAALGPARGRYGRRPDIIMLPRPWQVAAHLDDLQPLPADLADWAAYPPIWDGLLTQRGRRYGLPFKLAHKSMVWYRRDLLERFTPRPPATWSDWLVLNGEMAAAGVPALAVGAADGWVLTDIFENVLLGTAPEVYAQLEDPGSAPRPWVREPAVYQAFRLVGQLLSKPDVLPGGASRALAQQFPEAVVEVFGHGRAAMVIAADYAEPVVRRYALEPANVGVFAFPEIDAAQTSGSGSRARPLLVGGDVAVLTRSGDHAMELLARLAQPWAPLPWINGYGGFLAANPNTAGYSSARTDLLAHELGRLGDELAGRLRTCDPAVRFDLSDQLGQLGGTDGLWRVLQDLLIRVAGRPSQVDAAARDACTAMRDLEERLAQEASAAGPASGRPQPGRGPAPGGRRARSQPDDCGSG